MKRIASPQRLQRVTENFSWRPLLKRSVQLYAYGSFAIDTLDENIDKPDEDAHKLDENTASLTEKLASLPTILVRR